MNRAEREAQEEHRSKNEEIPVLFRKLGISAAMSLDRV
jgi:hypothetical protein